MACYRPIPAAQATKGGQIKLHAPMGEAHLALPCGKCIGCRTQKATEWAHRCEHEAKMWSHNIFITLTYDDEHLPDEGWLHEEHLRNFFKRLRKNGKNHPKIHRDNHSTNNTSKSNFRYFACGEYGTKRGRPHYHAIIFGANFTDRTKIGETPTGTLYTSETLKELWPYGNNIIGDATPAAANYIAQYALKKQGDGTTDKDGVWRPAPFLRMSQKPPIGQEWLAKYYQDLTHGYLVQNGKPRSIPRAYTKKLQDWQDRQHGPAKNDNFVLDTLRYHQSTRRRANRNLEAAEIIHETRKRQTEERKL